MTIKGFFAIMLLYDWKKISKEAGMSSRRIILAVYSMIARELPKNRYDPLFRYIKQDFTGSSFLVNPYALFHNRHLWTEKEVADYIGLASYRNLAEYRIHGKLTLDLSHSPVGKDAINKNRLLRIEGNDIHFLYEDYKEK